MEDTRHIIDLAFLKKHVRNFRSSGSGWTFSCPGHDDKHNSGSAFMGRDLRLHIHCHAGCSWENIKAGLGIASATFRPEATPEPRQHAAPDFRHILQSCIQDTTTQRLRNLAELIGVSHESLRNLGFAWHAPSNAWAIPMKDSAGEVIGIRLRSESGEKWAITGSTSGLFIPTTQPESEFIAITEGPTDTGAVLDWGISCIGRPSCNARIDLIQQYLTANQKLIAIFSNRDEAKTSATGEFYPGQEGAITLANQLRGQIKIILPPLMFKDWRQFKNAGGSLQSVLYTLKNTRPYEFWKQKHPSRKTLQYSA